MARAEPAQNQRTADWCWWAKRMEQNRWRAQARVVHGRWGVTGPTLPCFAFCLTPQRLRFLSLPKSLHYNRSASSTPNTRLKAYLYSLSMVQDPGRLSPVPRSLPQNQLERELPQKKTNNRREQFGNLGAEHENNALFEQSKERCTYLFPSRSLFLAKRGK